jgi:hypothetical protein
MTADAVRAFLTSRGGGLQRYSEPVASIAATQYCSAISEGQLSAAQIIAAVGATCNISQRALIVLHQKEQGTITSPNLTPCRLNFATGFGCPVTPDR